MKIRFSFIIVLLTGLVLTLTACGGGSTSTGSSAGAAKAAPAGPSGDASAGQEKFATTCTACHGQNGEGVPNLGKDMTTSEFIAGKTDAELLVFIKAGRDPSDPLNTTGVAMPPKGGNPSLNDQDLANIIAFIRTLQK